MLDVSPADMPLLWYYPFLCVFGGLKRHFRSRWVNLLAKVSMKPLNELEKIHTKPLFEVIKFTSSSFCENMFAGIQ
jgi:hypothetical protein